MKRGSKLVAHHVLRPRESMAESGRMVRYCSVLGCLPQGITLPCLARLLCPRRHAVRQTCQRIDILHMRPRVAGCHFVSSEAMSWVGSLAHVFPAPLFPHISLEVIIRSERGRCTSCVPRPLCTIIGGVTSKSSDCFKGPISWDWTTGDGR